MYIGLGDNKKDLDKRIDFIGELLEETIKKGNVSLDKQTLKIFVLPEFFMRGFYGAYFSEKGAKEFENTLVDRMKTILKENKISDDWIFVLGTILSSSSKIDYNVEPESELFKTGNHLLDIYNNLQNICKDSLKVFMEIIDEKITKDEGLAVLQKKVVENEENSFIDVLRKTLDYCDSKTKIEVLNRCIVMGGETRDVIRVIQKQYKSKEDFVLNFPILGKAEKQELYIQTATKYPPLENPSVKNDNPVFEYGNVRIGVEICLDHKQKRLVEHLKKENKYVDIQIISSCGMTIRENAVIADNGRYVFICDGEYANEDNPPENKEQASHTALKKVTKRLDLNDEKPEAKLETEEEILKDIPHEIPENLYFIDTSKPVVEKNCFIQIYKPMAL